MLTMVLILIFTAFAKPSSESSKLWQIVFSSKWYITAFMLIILTFMLKQWFTKDECSS